MSLPPAFGLNAQDRPAAVAAPTKATPGDAATTTPSIETKPGDTRQSVTPSDDKESPNTAGSDETSVDEADSGEKPRPMTAEEQAEYFELLKLFADTLDQVERNYVKEVSRRELMEAAIQGVLGKLDEYSDYIPPDQLESFRTGVENEFGGIGIRVGMNDGRLTVITPLYDTPAYRAGIMTGDQILRIGEQATEGMSLDDAIKRMKGRIGTELEITVRHSGSEAPTSVTLKRELVRMETIIGIKRKADDRWEHMLDNDQKIGYIRITSFSRQTHEDLRRVLKDLVEQGLHGLVLDLRFDPGGLLSSAIQVADLFLTEGTIVSTSGRNIATRTWTAHKEGTFDGFPMVVLVNRYSASASEIVAASLQDHHRAVIVGERTWGKGSVQNIIELEGGHSALKLTTAGYRRPSGKNIHRHPGATEADDWGVRPNEGFAISLSPTDTRRLLMSQQALDVIPSKAPGVPVVTVEPFIDPQLQKARDEVLDAISHPGKHLR